MLLLNSTGSMPGMSGLSDGLSLVRKSQRICARILSCWRLLELNRFEEKCPFRSWITRIAINRCLVRLRKGRQASNVESHLVQMDREMAEEALDRVFFASKDRQLESVPARLDLKRQLQTLKPGQSRRILEEIGLR